MDSQKLNKLLALALDNPHSEEARTAAIQVCKGIREKGVYLCEKSQYDKFVKHGSQIDRLTNELAKARAQIVELQAQLLNQQTNKTVGIFTRLTNLLIRDQW